MHILKGGNLLFLELHNSDTLKVMKEIVINGNVVKRTCTFGCTDTFFFEYNRFNKISKFEQRSKNGSSFTLYEYDSLGRLILEKINLKDINQKVYMFISTSYDEKLNRISKIYGNSNNQLNYDSETTFYDENKLPLRREIENHNESGIIYKIYIEFIKKST
jgi:hypothetical protein